MQPGVIQWFPGHMAKTRRLITECLPQVDIVLEVLDARVPKSSANPELSRLIGDKPLLKILNKAGLADPNASRLWRAFYEKRGIACVETDCISGNGLSSISEAVKSILSEKIARYEEKGMGGRALRAMVVGIPNVGKSSLINRLAGGKKAKVENRPGVTLTKQWVTAGGNLLLLDMPGVLWPKFENHAVGVSLALTGAIKDNILDLEDLSFRLLEILVSRYPTRLCERYRLEPEAIRGLSTYELFEAIAKKRGLIVSGGETDSDRTCRMLLDEFRRGIFGRISLEFPKEEA